MCENLVELVSDAELPMKCDGRIIGYYALGFDEALYMADHLIANDVVPVVRCKDCIHYDFGVCLKIYSDGVVSQYAWQVRNPDDFCSYGERKDND